MGAIGEVEELLQKSGQAKAAAAAEPEEPAAASSSISARPRTATAKPARSSPPIRPCAPAARQSREEDDGNETLAKFLVQHRLVPEEIVASALERIAKKNKARNPNMLAGSLIDEICRRGAFELEDLLSGILDRSKFAYIPLEYYEVDRSVVKMLPEEHHPGAPDRPL